MLTHTFSPDGAPFPTPTLVPSDILPPVGYIVWRKTQLCTNCGARTKWCELYTKHPIKSRPGFKVEPTTRLTYRMPIERRWNDYRTPICHECADSNMPLLAALPPPPLVDAKPKLVPSDRPATYVAKRPIAAALAAAKITKLRKEAAKTAKGPKTLDDILKL